MEDAEEIIERLKAQIHRLEADNQFLRRNEENINAIMVEFIDARSKQISRHVALLKEEEDDNKAFLTRIKSTLGGDADEIQVVKVDPSKNKSGTKRPRLIDETLSNRNTDNDNNAPTDELNNEELKTEQNHHGSEDGDNNNDRNQGEDFAEIPRHVHRESKAKAKAQTSATATSAPKGIDIESSIYVKLEPSSSSETDTTDCEEEEEEEEEEKEEAEAEKPTDNAEEADEQPMSNNNNDNDNEQEEDDGEEESFDDKPSSKTKYIHSGLTFTNRLQAQKYLKNREYTHRKSKTAGSITKMWYYCKYDKKCPVRSQIIVSNLSNTKEQVDLYTSKQVDHNHSSSQQRNKDNIPDDQKEFIQSVIDRDFRNGCVSTSVILKEMKNAKLIKRTRSRVLYKYIRNFLFKIGKERQSSYD